MFNIFFLLIVSNLLAEEVHHPQPKDPIFIKAEFYQQILKDFPEPPKPKSEAQSSDEKELFRQQKSRSSEDCERAKKEVFVTLENFFGGRGGELSTDEIQKLTPFFNQVRNDGDYFIQKLKRDFPRQRPFVYIKGLEPCVPREDSGAFPSGHATLAKLYALILSKIFPKRSSELDKKAQVIANDRVLSGMHHPTDIKAGKDLAIKIFAELQRSESFKKALDEAKAALR